MGSLMRHYLALSAPRAVSRLTGGMAKPAGPALLIAPAGALQRDPPRVVGAGARAVAVSAVADPAQEEELLAVRSDADDQPQRVHALPRSGRGGLDNHHRLCEEGSGDSHAPKV